MPVVQVLGAATVASMCGMWYGFLLLARAEGVRGQEPEQTVGAVQPLERDRMLERGKRWVRIASFTNFAVIGAALIAVWASAARGEMSVVAASSLSLFALGALLFTPPRHAAPGSGLGVVLGVALRNTRNRFALLAVAAGVTLFWVI